MKIVLTGGPSAGKTTIVQIIEREFKDKIISVPESANILFKGGFPRGASEDDLIHQQKAIYYVQRELESLTMKSAPQKSLICDRGSLDGLAYWPEKSSISFFDSLYTSMQNEVSRYDWVLHLETSSSFFYDTSNPVRVESYEQAKIIDEKIKQAWAKHPHQVIIRNSHAFSQKVKIVLEYIEQLLEHKTIKTL